MTTQIVPPSTSSGSARKAPTIHLWYGKNSFLLHEELSLWKKRFKEKYSDLNTITFDESEYANERFVRLLPNAVKGDSLFGATKLIILKNLLSTKKTAPGIIEAIEDVLKNPTKNTFIVFFQSETITQKKLYSRIGVLEKNGSAQVKEFPLPASPMALSAELLAYAKKNNILIDTRTLKTLIERTTALSDYNAKIDATAVWTVAQELNKLSVYTKGEPITENVLRVFQTTLSSDVLWSLINALLTGNAKKSAGLIATRLTTISAKDHATELRAILTILAKQIESLLTVKRLAPQALSIYAKKVRWSPGRQFMVKKQAEALSEERLAALQEKTLSLFLTSVNFPKVLKAEFVLKLL